MVKKIVSLSGIFIIASLAWMVLGVNLAQRTSAKQREMASAVGYLWGTPHLQTAPVIFMDKMVKKEFCNSGEEKTKCETREIKEWETVDLAKSDVKVELGLDMRRKGLLWFSLYGVKFAADYKIKNTQGEPREFLAAFYFPNKSAIYDDLEVKIAEKPDAEIKQISAEPRTNEGSYDQDEPDYRANALNGGMVARMKLNPGEEVTLHVGYRSRGKDEWRYSFGNSVKVIKNFKLTINTDFEKIDFPANSISPDQKQKNNNGWELVWDKKSLISGFNVAVQMPQHINPGPLAERMSFFAPVSLLFFFSVMFVITLLRNIKIHPMNFVFLAAAFFAFHLLFAYTVDHIDVYLAFAISSAVSIFLVVSYLRLVVGAKFALLEAGGSQFLYLVVFSFAHFFEGYTGLIITVLSIITLFVIMQITAKIDWEEKFKINL